MDCRERGSHAQSVHPTQEISSIEIVNVKQEEEADKNNSKIVRHKQERNVGTKRKINKQDLTGSEDLILMHRSPRLPLPYIKLKLLT